MQMECNFGFRLDFWTVKPIGSQTLVKSDRLVTEICHLLLNSLYHKSFGFRCPALSRTTAGFPWPQWSAMVKLRGQDYFHENSGPSGSWCAFVPQHNIQTDLIYILKKKANTYRQFCEYKCFVRFCIPFYIIHIVKKWTPKKMFVGFHVSGPVAFLCVNGVVF